MQLARRALLACAAAAAAIRFSTPTKAEGTTKMYGLINKLVSVQDRRADLIAALKESMGQMPGCLSYVIAEDAADPNTIWVTEIWASQSDHDASLTLPAVKDAVGKARPMIASFSKVAVTNPVAGVSNAEK